MSVVRYAWYVCDTGWCVLKGVNTLIEDLVEIKRLEGQHLYRMVPVCGKCGQDLSMLGRPAENPPR